MQQVVRRGLISGSIDIVQLVYNGYDDAYPVHQVGSGIRNLLTKMLEVVLIKLLERPPHLILPTGPGFDFPGFLPARHNHARAFFFGPP